ncbi:MAG: polyamine aminopropyltransferase [Clostridiales bacterium]|nr:polyamine aminopropyltransferase [Clostridiales bacterium]
MDLWFTENHTKNVRFSIKVDKHLHSERSEFQRIDVFKSYEFGNFLTLDGLMMVTERDEFAYHEMIVHPAMAVNPEIKNILVIGAGDGGTVRELCHYTSIQKIDLVEIDKRVVEVCKMYLPQTACKLDDNRVEIFYEDGLKFVRKKQDFYDLIIVDSTDPFGPGEGLFTKEFYGNCYNALTQKGILINQHESPFYEPDKQSMILSHKRISSVFPVHEVYQFHMPTYPSGHWLFGFAGKYFHPIKNFNEEYWNSLNIKTRYYNTDIHKGAFALPTYVKDLLSTNQE